MRRQRAQNGIKNRKENAENQQVSSAVPSPHANTVENDDGEKQSRSETPKSHHQLSSSPFDTSHLAPKLLTPPASFDAFFSRPHPQFNFYSHHLLTQPLNFSANRLPFPTMLPQSPILSSIPSPANANGNTIMEDLYKKEKMLQEKRMKPANLKKIDRIAESLRFGANSTSPPSSSSPSSTKSFLEHFNQMTVKKESPTNSVFSLSPNSLQSTFMNNEKKPTIENLLNYSNDAKKTGQTGQNNQTTQSNTLPSNQTQTTAKIPNSKLFAKCFICSKLLSNQYNLRVHLETHQNMRWDFFDKLFFICNNLKAFSDLSLKFSAN